MIINLSKADLQKGQIITPGWYKCEIIDFVSKPSKDQQSVNYTPHFKLETPNEEVIDNHNFNSKAPGFMTDFLAAMAGKTRKEFLDSLASDGVKVDTDSYKGKKLQIKVKNAVFEGRMKNELEGFLPYGAEVPF